MRITKRILSVAAALLAVVLVSVTVWITYIPEPDPIEFERTTGLGAVATTPPAFSLRHMWRRPQPAPALPAAFLVSGLSCCGPQAAEEYGALSESGFLDASASRLSTFSIDVDSASYTNIRRMLEQGRVPPAEAVRIEDIVNFFPYSYPDPAGPHPFSVSTEVAVCPWARGSRLLRIGLKSKSIGASNLPPSHLTFLIDVSGSMQDPQKLPLVKRSFALLIDQLRPEDTVAIAVYAGAAGLVLAPTPGSQKAIIQDALNGLDAGGSTAGGEGIRLAYSTARSMHRQGANNRVILATDGDFNVGVSSERELIGLIESERNRGVYLTVLGYGTGDLKDNKLELLANHGNGHYAYVDSLLEARRVLVEQIGATLETVAQDVKVQVEFNPARIARYRLMGYESRRLKDVEFRDDTRDAGDLGAGHMVTALYEVVPAFGQPLPADAFTVRLRYKPPHSNQSVELTAAGKEESASPSADFRFAAAAAQFGMLLARSPYLGESTMASVVKQAEAATADDPRRVAFVALAQKAAGLTAVLHESGGSIVLR